jgi:hypothetical protein
LSAKKRIIITVNLYKLNKIRKSAERGNVSRKIPEKFENVVWLREIKDIVRIIANLALSAGMVRLSIKQRNVKISAST